MSIIESENEPEPEHYETIEHSSTDRSSYSVLEMTQRQLSPPLRSGHTSSNPVGVTNAATDAQTGAELPTASSAQTTPGSPAPRSTPGPKPQAPAPVLPSPNVPAPRPTHGSPPSVAPLTHAEQATRGAISPLPLAPPPPESGATSNTHPKENSKENQNPKENMHEHPDADKRASATSTHEYDLLSYEAEPPVSERGVAVQPTKPPPPVPPQEQQLPKPKPRKHAPQSGPGLQTGTSADPNCPKNEESAHVPSQETPAGIVEAQHPKAPCGPLLPPEKVSSGHENSSGASGGSSQSAQSPIATHPIELNKSNFCTPEQSHLNAYTKESRLPENKESAVGSKAESKNVHLNARAFSSGQEYAQVPVYEYDEIATHFEQPVVGGSESSGESAAAKKVAASMGIANKNSNAVNETEYEDMACNESGSTDEEKPKNKFIAHSGKSKEKVDADAKQAANAKRLLEYEKLPQEAIGRYIGSKRLPPRQSGELLELCTNVVREMLAGVKREHKLPVVRIAVTENAFKAVQTSDAKKRDKHNKKKHVLNATEPDFGSDAGGVSREFPLDYISNWQLHSEEKRVLFIITMESAATRYAASDLHAYFLDTDIDARRISHAIRIAFRKRSAPQQQPQPIANTNACQPVS